MQLSRADIHEGREFEVVIDDFGFTGEGFVRLSDGWLSVPGALPGERIIARLQPGQREGARRLFADIVEILKSSPLRRDPLCERDRICRGCHLRHITVAGELEFKVRTIREVMERFAQLDVAEQPDIEVITAQPTARGDSFRIRSQITYKRRPAGFELGLYSPISEGLIAMDTCPALTAPVQRLIAAIEKSLHARDSLPWDEKMAREVGEQTQGFDVDLGVCSIKVVAPTYGVGLVEVNLTEAATEEHFQSQIEEGRIGAWVRSLALTVPDQVGVAIRSGAFRHIEKEPRRIRIPIGDWQMEVGYDDWFHATLKPAEQVYQRLMQWLDLGDDDRFLDIGCGAGTIALMASETAKYVVGVDANRSSIEAAEINAANHECENIYFRAGGWEKVLRKLVMEGQKFDVATINPMREPLGDRPLAFVNALGVERLVYIGPSPEAAARDIGSLRQMGWKVERLAAGNLHPATYHTLLMASLIRQG